VEAIASRGTVSLSEGARCSGMTMKNENKPGARRYLEELLACPGVEEELILRSRIGFMAFHGGGLEEHADTIERARLSREWRPGTRSPIRRPKRGSSSGSRVLERPGAELDDHEPTRDAEPWCRDSEEAHDERSGRKRSGMDEEDVQTKCDARSAAFPARSLRGLGPGRSIRCRTDCAALVSACRSCAGPCTPLVEDRAAARSPPT